jgi:hypothetical protein
MPELPPVTQATWPDRSIFTWKRVVEGAREAKLVGRSQAAGEASVWRRMACRP